MSKTTRHDMLVELVTDQINSIEQMIRNDEYDDIHHWLHPILLRELKLDYADWSDDDLKNYYCDQLGVDIPEVPTLSSDDEETEELVKACFGQAPSQETANRGSLPQPSGMEYSTVPDIHSISDEKGMAEMAATLRGIARREETIHGLQPTTEVRIPMRLLLRLVHGESCLS